MSGGTRRQLLVQLGGAIITTSFAGCVTRPRSANTTTSTRTTSSTDRFSAADVCLFNNSEHTQTIRLAVVDVETENVVLNVTRTVPSKGKTSFSDPVFHPANRRTYRVRISLEIPDVEHSKRTRSFPVGDGSGFECIYVGVTLCGGLYWQIRTNDEPRTTTTKG